jgi:hypothetical protein
MKMYKLSILVLTLFASTLLYGQNPGVNSVQVQPAPLTGVGSAAVLSFNIGNFSPLPISGTTLSRRMGFVASLTKNDPVPNSVAAMSGSILTAFDVTYDAATHSFVGVQKANFEIPALAVYTANINAQVTMLAPITNLSIGLGVNIQPAPFYAVANAPGDDYAAAFTYTGAPLAIGPVQFDVVSRNCEAQLNWQLTKADDIVSFEVYESTNGTDYKLIKTLQPETGKLNYTYNVSHQIGGLKYYYVIVKDKAGEALKTSAKIIKLDCNSFVITLSPNPTSDVVNLNFNALKVEKMQLKVYDEVGKLLQLVETQTTIGNNVTTIDLSKYAMGNYIISCNIGSKASETFKVTKQ